MLCIRCAGVLVYDDLMRPQATSADELEAIYERAPEIREEVDKAQDVVHVVNAIRHTIKMKRRKAKDVPDALARRFSGSICVLLASAKV